MRCRLTLFPMQSSNHHKSMRDNSPILLHEKRAAMLPWLCAILTLLVAGCSKKAKDEAAKSEKKEESRVQRGTNGEVIVRLEADTQKVMGLQVAPLQPISLSPETKAYGRVLDPSGLVTAVSDLGAARATSEASQAE